MSEHTPGPWKVDSKYCVRPGSAFRSSRAAGASMTPQERAAAVKLYEKILSYSPDQEALEAGDDKDFEAIRQALTETRRAALLEAAQVAITYGERARDEDLSGSYTSELIVQALDRLAQEG